MVKVLVESGIYKFEVRNTKFETISNVPNPKHKAFLFWAFEHLDLFRISIFGFRISKRALLVLRAENQEES
jgi:hypothetical protein